MSELPATPSPLPPGLERIAPRATELGEGLVIRRALPTRQRRMVGAWCFLDHIGPVDFGPGEALHVGAHPHIGLQTFTWMIEGQLMHRDSLGSAQLIRPGQVNLMTAGRGIVHTEDSEPEGQRLHAAQLWIALPEAQRERAPAFAHHPELPRWQEAGCAFTLLAGHWQGRQAPPQVYTPLVGLELLSTAGSALDLALAPDFEHGLLVLEGHARLAGEDFAQDEFAYLAPGASALALELAPGSRLLLLGGVPFEPVIQMWWNFVAPDRETLIRAQDDWEAGHPRFGRVVGDEGRRLAAPPLPWARHRPD